MNWLKKLFTEDSSSRTAKQTVKRNKERRERVRAREKELRNGRDNNKAKDAYDINAQLFIREA